MLTTIISLAELAGELAEDDWVVVDCRFDLARPAAGETDYGDAHVPGARYAHLERDLSAPVTADSGRHPLPDRDVLARKFSLWGIRRTSQIVAYDAGNAMYAARLWWLARWLGHASVAVLDGGFRAWVEARLPVSSVSPTPAATGFVAGPPLETAVDAASVARTATDPTRRLLDARAAARYAGEIEPIDARAGHVPGAVNHPFERSIDPATGCLLEPAALREALIASLDAVPPGRTTVMCGSGVTACHVLLALAASGLHGAQLYAGSWSEWIRDPTHPIAIGSEPGPPA
jgi:thiosulfate/3-mercaptopyruvate sulfurtransferase